MATELCRWVGHVLARINHLNTDENARGCTGKIAMILVDQCDETPFGMTNGVVAEFFE